MMKSAAALGIAALLLGVTHAGLAAADAPSREDAERQARVVARIKESLPAEATAAGKFALLRRLLSDEPNPDIRRVILDATPPLPGFAAKSFRQRDEFVEIGRNRRKPARFPVRLCGLDPIL